MKNEIKEKKIKNHKVSFTLSSLLKKEDKDLLNFMGFRTSAPEVIIRKEVRK